jgi:uncharacterized membrane protein
MKNWKSAVVTISAVLGAMALAATASANLSATDTMLSGGKDGGSVDRGGKDGGSVTSGGKDGGSITTGKDGGFNELSVAYGKDGG